MDIEEKQARWSVERPLFEAEFIHSHLLPFFNFNENTGDYEIKSACVSKTDDEDRKVAYEALNTGWAMWLRAKRTSNNPYVAKKFFSHDFNDDGFKFHDTLKEAEAESELNLDYYRDRVADGRNVTEMGEFHELCYGVVIGSAGYCVDELVTAEHHRNGKHTKYEIGTEILSLFLEEAEEPAND
ncbi:hypothetical protein NVT87_11175 [Acinetobacter radioresistens]|uniref:hypothetical protein n=1 Tax=Acinetobacter radioresistens TaxID=40216 RepID=UPI002245A0E5|nr:hypothetical protein [Acinetobacter radioresistens]MCX0331443.1 hypothetical protein [Acinetobacter radioresistens]